MRRLAAFLLLALPISCQSEPAQPAWDEQAVRDEVRALLADYGSTINEQNWEKSIQFFADDPRFYWAEDGRVRYTSHQKIVEAVRSFYPSVQEIAFSASDIRVTPLSAESAVVTVVFNQRMVMSSGVDFNFSGANTIYLEKFPQGWKFLIGHSSSLREQAGG